MKSDKPLEIFAELTEEKEAPPNFDELPPELKKWYKET